MARCYHTQKVRVKAVRRQHRASGYCQPRAVAVECTGAVVTVTSDVHSAYKLVKRGVNYALEPVWAPKAEVKFFASAPLRCPLKCNPS